jgi:hypothetical protein
MNVSSGCMKKIKIVSVCSSRAEHPFAPTVTSVLITQSINTIQLIQDHYNLLGHPSHKEGFSIYNTNNRLQSKILALCPRPRRALQQALPPPRQTLARPFHQQVFALPRPSAASNPALWRRR